MSKKPGPELVAKFVNLANIDRRRRDAHLLSARVADFMIRISKKPVRRPTGSRQYEEADSTAEACMLAEYQDTGVDQHYALAQRYLDTHPDHPGASRDASLRRLGERIKPLLRKS